MSQVNVQVAENVSDIGGRILHILSVYPRISPSMLQISLNIPAGVWKPVLENLVARRQVARQLIVTETPGGRHQSYTVISPGAESPFPTLGMDGLPVVVVDQGTQANGTHSAI